jgi:ABC-type polysaccharide/polyol phosphate export permease
MPITPGRALLSPFRALVLQRRVIEIFVARDLRARYVNSALGLWWAVIQPLALLAVYTFVFSVIIPTRFGGGDAGSGEFALYLFCGLLPWLAFADAVTRSSSVLIEQAPLIKKVVFPSEILPVHLVLSALLVELIGLTAFLVVLVALGRVPGPALLAIPVVLALQFLFTAGVAWALATFAVYLRDVRQLVGLVLILWMFLTPIIWPADIVPARFVWVLRLNPMSYVVEAYRGAVLHGSVPDPASLAVLAGMALTTFVCGYWVFHRSKQTFADLL